MGLLIFLPTAIFPLHEIAPKCIIHSNGRLSRFVDKFKWTFISTHKIYRNRENGEKVMREKRRFIYCPTYHTLGAICLIHAMNLVNDVKSVCNLSQCKPIVVVVHRYKCTNIIDQNRCFS